MSFLLPPPPEGWSAAPEAVASLSGFPYERTVQPAGKGYHKLLKKLSGAHVEDEEDRVETNQDEETAAPDSPTLRNLTKEADYYELLGLGETRWRATENDIKMAYRKMILIYHPDKLKGEGEEEAQANGADDEIFKAIQKAYDTLSDHKKRRTYDSQDEFDDTIPTERQAERSIAKDVQNFFKLFDPVFERNARWSNIQPAPKFGDINTPYEAVQKFYDFWWDFKTWRDFTDKDEHDLEQAESRDEKRWMMQQNEKMKADKKKEERARILRLAETAHKFDPRIKKYEQEKELEKQKKKEEKQNARRKQAQEADRAAEEERLKKEADERAKAEDAAEKKKQKEKDQKALKKNRSNLRKLCKSLPEPPAEEDVDTICAKFSAIQLADLCKSMQVGETAQRGPFDDVINGMKQDEQEKEDALKSDYDKRRQERDRPWTEEELTALAKGLVKYPGGVQNRWDLIAELIPTRKPRDIASKVKDVKTAQIFAKNNFFGQKDPFEKVKGNAEKAHITAAPSERYETDETFVPSTKSVEEVNAAAAKENGVAAAANGKEEHHANGKQADVSEAANSEATESVWSADEQKLLEQGLQKFPTGTDRWDKITELIGTKSKKEVVARFKALVSMYKGKK